ncbi:MAG: efflux RND transporter periplasmic adaptor subunit [Anderseniella sp.]
MVKLSKFSIFKISVLTVLSVTLGILSFAPVLLAATADGNQARGVVKATAEAALATELSAIVRKVPFRDGEAFRKGDLLIGFDCARYEAGHKAARSAHVAESITAANNRKLLKHQAVGRNEVAISEARAAKAKSEADAIKTRLVNCEIHAPFDGRVVERAINEHEMAKPGEAMMRIVASGPREINIIVPSTWMTWMKQGVSFSFLVDETGETLAGKVARLGAAVDPVSKTVKIIGTFAETSERVLPGMSGSATFARSGS